VLLCALPAAGLADCWMIETAGGHAIATSNLWQIRNRVSGQSALVGKIDGSQGHVSLADVVKFTVNKRNRRGAVELDIRLQDERTLTMSSDMDLYYLVDKKRRPIRLAEVSSVSRCPEEAKTDRAVAAGSATTAVAGSPDSAQQHAVVVTTAGDILNGTLADDDITWHTTYGQISFRPADIRLIILHCADDQPGVLETIAGDRLGGTLANQIIAMRLSTGQVLSIPAGQIDSIDRSSGNGTSSPDRVAPCHNRQD
jgi:hypothetical protein